MKNKKSVLIKSLFLLFGVVAILILMEAGLAFFFPPHHLGPTLTEFDEVYGLKLKENISARITTPEFSTLVSTNVEGRRGPEIEPSQPSILFFGDSYTMGYGVSDGEEFVSLLREDFKDEGYEINFINWGIGKTGNGRVLKLLAREAAHFNPLLVVIQITGNDFLDNQSLFSLSEDGTLEERALKKSFLRESQELIESIPFSSYSRILAHLKHALILLLERHYERKGIIKRNDEEADLVTYAILNQIFRYSKTHSWNMIALTVECSPERGQKIAEIASQYGIPVIEAPRKETRSDLYYRVDDHWNAEGHKYTAQLLKDQIRKHLKKPLVP